MLTAMQQLYMILTVSPLIPLRLYALPPFLIFGHSSLSARAPECQKIKIGGLGQYGTEPFKQQQFGTAGVEGVKLQSHMLTFC